MALVYGGAFALLSIPCLFVNPIVALLPLGAGIYMFFLKKNYTSELCKELSIVVGDMKTGNQEKALQRMETRVKSTMLSEVVRGLLSFMRGDNMVTYFESLNLKLTSLWQQRLKGQALAKEPKISMLSYLLTGAATGLSITDT